MDEDVKKMLIDFVNEAAEKIAGFDRLRAGEYDLVEIHAQAIRYCSLHSQAKALRAILNRPTPPLSRIDTPQE